MTLTKRQRHKSLQKRDLEGYAAGELVVFYEAQEKTEHTRFIRYCTHRIHFAYLFYRTRETSIVNVHAFVPSRISRSSVSKPISVGSSPSRLLLPEIKGAERKETNQFLATEAERKKYTEELMYITFLYHLSRQTKVLT